MRIRKRQPVIVETPTASSHVSRPLSSITHEVQQHFVGQNSYCSRAKQHEVTRKEAERHDASPVRIYVAYPRTNKLEGFTAEAQSVDYLRAETMLPRKEKIGSQTGGIMSDARHNTEVKTDETRTRPCAIANLAEDAGRVRGDQDVSRSTNERAEVSRVDRAPSLERDLNHPSNNPKESLLYSLYSVFSRLSGKSVLTAREALSKIIEEGLPGLDEEIGLPSVQVGKVMRSNPYFVHLEGGKFFLRSGRPDRYGDEDEGSDGQDRESSPAVAGVSQQAAASVDGIGKRDRGDDQQDDTGSRNKRARSKISSSTDLRDKSDSNLRPEDGAQISSRKSQTSLLQNPSTDVAVQICKRYDGRGWKCHETALDGYSMCRHHHELIVNRLARLRNSGRLGSKKSLKRRKSNGKQVKETPAVIEGDLTNEQNETQWRKNVKARSLKSIN